MLFSSTKDKNQIINFKEGVFKGLAPDGGLYHPTDNPDLRNLLDSFNSKTSFIDVATSVSRALFADEIKAEQAAGICRAAFSFEPKLVQVSENLNILELFHGPTAAFKDFGAGFLAACMEEFLKDQNKKAIILTATSGDTGSAVAQAFYQKSGIQVIILYPSGRVSRLQEKQLTTYGGNITALEVDGSFDDCQNMVKKAFTDQEMDRKLPLTSANSINLGRLIPQSFYYIWAWIRQRSKSRNNFFCVPSGNFGNLTAGVLAMSWGMDANGFIAATNSNDVVPEYLQGKGYTPRASAATLSNAMDVGDPSNFQRLRAFFGKDWRNMKKSIIGDSVSDQETLAAITEAKQKHNLVLDPHTAVAYHCAAKTLASDNSKNLTILATAHPAKFQETVIKALGEEPELPKRLEQVLDLPKQSIKINNTYQSLKNILLDRV